MSRYLGFEITFFRDIVPWPECQLELPGDGGDGDGDGGAPTTLPTWQEPWTITHRNQISCVGIPHFDMNVRIFRENRVLHNWASK